MSKLDTSIHEEIEQTQRATNLSQHSDIVSKKRKGKESIFSKINTIVQASQKMIKDIKANQYPILPNETIDEITKVPKQRDFCYSSKQLLQKEYDFFMQNSTPLGVLESLNYYIKEEEKQQYALFPVVHFSQQQLEGINTY